VADENIEQRLFIVELTIAVAVISPNVPRRAFRTTRGRRLVARTEARMFSVGTNAGAKEDGLLDFEGIEGKVLVLVDTSEQELSARGAIRPCRLDSHVEYGASYDRGLPPCRRAIGRFHLFRSSKAPRRECEYAAKRAQR
jgi:hypothetical protein